MRNVSIKKILCLSVLVLIHVTACREETIFDKKQEIKASYLNNYNSKNNNQVFNQAITLYKQGDYQNAFPLIKSLAEQNDVRAQIILGIMYSRGNGVSIDDGQAFYWYKNAAYAGDSDAQYLLGESYYAGKGVEKNLEQARLWWQKAAISGNAGGEFALGCLYFKGEGVKKDVDSAIIWWKKSAQHGDKQAKKVLGIIYRDGYEHISKDEKQSSFYLNQ